MRWDIDSFDGRRAKRTRRTAILYARFSPRPNAKECESIERQLEELRIWCSRAGYEIAGEFVDPELSGGEGLEERPGLSQAIAAMKSNYTLLVRSYDRFFRDNLQGQTLMFALAKKRCRVVSITEPMGSCAPPFGQKVDPMDKTRLIVNPQEIGIVEEIRTMHFDKGMGACQIARELNRLQRRCRKAKRWHHTQVKRIIDRMVVGSGDTY